MNELKLQIREHIIPDDESPSLSNLNILELIGFLDHKTTARCLSWDSFKYKERMKKQLAENFKQTLYGQIIRAIEKAEYETRANCFSYSSSAEDKIRTTFEELRSSIPQITYDWNTYNR